MGAAPETEQPCPFGNWVSRKPVVGQLRLAGLKPDTEYAVHYGYGAASQIRTLCSDADGGIVDDYTYPHPPPERSVWRAIHITEPGNEWPELIVPALIGKVDPWPPMGLWYTWGFDDPYTVTIGVHHPLPGDYTVRWGDDTGEIVSCDGHIFTATHTYVQYDARRNLTVTDPAGDREVRVVVRPEIATPVWLEDPHNEPFGSGYLVVKIADARSEDTFLPIMVDWGIYHSRQLKGMFYPVTPSSRTQGHFYSLREHGGKKINVVVSRPTGPNITYALTVPRPDEPVTRHASASVDATILVEDLGCPIGITARHTPGWAYLTVPSPPDPITVEVEYAAPGQDWRTATRQGAEHLVEVYAAPQHGDGPATQFRVRFSDGGEHSGWTTGHVAAPDTLVVDEATRIAPRPPTDLRHHWHTGTDCAIAWRQADTADAWKVSYSIGGGKPVTQIVSEPFAEVGPVPMDQAVDITVHALLGGVESDAASLHLPAGTGQPSTPTDLVLTATADGVQARWEQFGVPNQWQVMWADHEPDDASADTAPPAPEGDGPSGKEVLARSQYDAQSSGNEGLVQVYQEPAFTIRSVVPGTVLHVSVYTRYRGSYSPYGVHGTVTVGGGSAPADD